MNVIITLSGVILCRRDKCAAYQSFFVRAWYRSCSLYTRRIYERARILGQTFSNYGLANNVRTELSLTIVDGYITINRCVENLGENEFPPRVEIHSIPVVRPRKLCLLSAIFGSSDTDYSGFCTMKKLNFRTNLFNCPNDDYTHVSN